MVSCYSGLVLWYPTAGPIYQGGTWECISESGTQCPLGQCWKANTRKKDRGNWARAKTFWEQKVGVRREKVNDWLAYESVPNTNIETPRDCFISIACQFLMYRPVLWQQSPLKFNDLRLLQICRENHCQSHVRSMKEQYHGNIGMRKG